MASTLSTPSLNGAGPSDSSDIFAVRSNSLDAIFSPKSVAVIGATENPGSVGRTLLWNLITNPFGGTVYPVNPKRPNVLGVKAYPSVSALPEVPDLAVIVTPAPSVPKIIAECVELGVRGAIVISAGFKETGPAGVELERQIMELARGKMRIIGPNCLGVMSPLTGLNATFASTIARPGRVGFISQSGALCTAVLDWSLQEDVGFSAFVSIGSMLDVDWGDLIDYLGDDPNTDSILIYMETVGDARAFLSAAKEVALTKPIIVIKAGRTAQAAQAAASHTGSLAGSDDVLDAAFSRCGVLRVDNIMDLFSMADVLAKQPRPKGNRLTIVTNAGGPGVLATDRLITDGGALAEISEETKQTLNGFLPAAWSHSNPIDVLGDAGADRYAKTLEVSANDPNSDGLLVILTPQAMTDATLTAEQLRPYAKSLGKPLLTSWMGGTDVEKGRTILSRAEIPQFDYPDLAVQAFSYMWRYSKNLHGLYETPSMQDESNGEAPDRAKAAAIIGKARKQGRTLLDEWESKQLLSAYGISTVDTRIATDPEQAVAEAKAIGFPVVLKLYSHTITHKTDVGGVKLNLADEEAVRQAYIDIETSVSELASASDFEGVTVQKMEKLEGYEIILGSSLDSQFGPVLLFGSGGQLVEVYKDSALGLPPLNSTLARRMMEQTKIYEALKGVRGRAPVDMDALEHLLVRFSQLVAEQRWIKELDINPLLASPERIVALDARVVLHDVDVKEEDLPTLAIRPYPIQYVTSWEAKDGSKLMLRPIRPEDEPLMVEFHQTLSERSVYQRYFRNLDLAGRVEHERLIRRCFVDYDREIAIVAERRDARTNTPEIVGVGRLVRDIDANQAQFAVVVSDAVQRQGLGKELMAQLIEVARAENVKTLVSGILPDNGAMQHICESFGFRLTPPETQGGLIHAVLEL